MKKLGIILLLIISMQSFAQKSIKIELSESYELGNIILALTNYGKTDPWDVQKIPPYYNEIMTYFEPVKNHPLLDSVNYSRKDWKKFIGFRSDMFAFSFDSNGKLKRDYPFNLFDTIKDADKYLNLINDFAAKSNYREFYNNHKDFYSKLISNYREYYFIDKSYAFLDKIAKKPNGNNKTYVIAISPLVGGQNCHTDIDSIKTTVDFPNIGKDLILGKFDNIEQRIIDNHTIFTEIDHGYINPISEKYSKPIEENFDLKKWDKNSGYNGIASFNEYMTWAIYDLFIQENFPKEKTDSISNIYWKQNATRGFIAQNLFSKKISKFYRKSKNIESLYDPMLKWSKKIQGKISQPYILNADSKNFQKLDKNNIVLNFSEPMTKSKTIELKLFQFENGKQTKNQTSVIIKNPIWSKDRKQVKFKIETDYKEFAIGFYIWNSMNSLYSENGILLNANNYILVKE
jgi:hypothetical protein